MQFDSYISGLEADQVPTPETVYDVLKAKQELLDDLIANYLYIGNNVSEPDSECSKFETAIEKSQLIREYNAHENELRDLMMSIDRTEFNEAHHSAQIEMMEEDLRREQ